MKIFFRIIVIIICYFLALQAQEQSEGLKKLSFMVGEWESVSENQITGEESTGKSSIQLGIGGKWLLWEFRSKQQERMLEVLTLINYHKEKRQYAFISFNSINDDPLIHYGNWIDKNTLRLEILEQGVEVGVEFTLKENGDFSQEHSRITPSGEKIITAKTNYSRIK